MDKLYVYADFNWLEKPMLVGELGYESIRGSQSYSFKYSPEWLNRHASIILSEDIRNYPGVQYTQPGKEIFGCFSDSLPDRWGTTLLKRREQTLAKEEGRPVRNLTSFDMIMGIEDESRMGGFRFSKSPDGQFINTSDRLSVPPIISLRELIAASHAIEEAEEKGLLVDQKWIYQLHKPGTSLGGARPKANVIDEDGLMKMAKFPSRNDTFDVELWEHIAHVLAKNAKINVAETRVVKVGSQYHTLLSNRFDRTNDGRRIHYASALTMLGLKDGTGSAEIMTNAFLSSEQKNEFCDLLKPTKANNPEVVEYIEKFSIQEKNYAVSRYVSMLLAIISFAMVLVATWFSTRVDTRTFNKVEDNVILVALSTITPILTMIAIMFYRGKSDKSDQK